jgi:hypothetical protein
MSEMLHGEERQVLGEVFRVGPDDREQCRSGEDGGVLGILRIAHDSTLDVHMHG